MANITNKRNIFFVTSPRTPFKMIDEIRLLIDKLGGKPWDIKTQTEFAKLLSKADFFEGKIENNLDFAARDRINRAPKALGFVNLQPKLEITEAGKLFISGRRTQEVFLRQLLKFQLPSPYHIDKNNEFNIKPYLELMRLVLELNGLSKDEIALFVMQLINIKDYKLIINKIIDFRNTVKSIDHKITSYRRVVRERYIKELTELYKSEIQSGEVDIRQSDNSTVEKFILTKSSNFRDYADAAIRYLRATELFAFDFKTNRLLPSKYKLNELTYILKTIDRDAYEFKSINDFKDYLFSSNNVTIFSDNINDLISEIIQLGLQQSEAEELRKIPIEEIKDKRDDLLQSTRIKNIEEQVQNLQTYSDYEDITTTYADISSGNIVDPSLVFEWNTWRAFTMLDDGLIKGNFKFDLQGMPLFNAPGNKPDIECEYKDYGLIVEVTLSSGQKQYEMEGEPVARHLGNYKKETSKDAYCLFIAEKLNPATLAHFYLLNKSNIAYYGGKSKIIPLEINDLLKLLEIAYKSKSKPRSMDIRNFIDNAIQLVEATADESDWYKRIGELTKNWYGTSSIQS